jgi:hypothetical protein
MVGVRCGESRVVGVESLSCSWLSGAGDGVGAGVPVVNYGHGLGAGDEFSVGVVVRGAGEEHG